MRVTGLIWIFVFVVIGLSCDNDDKKSIEGEWEQFYPNIGRVDYLKLRDGNAYGYLGSKECYADPVTYEISGNTVSYYFSESFVLTYSFAFANDTLIYFQADTIAVKYIPTSGLINLYCGPCSFCKGVSSE